VDKEKSGKVHFVERLEILDLIRFGQLCIVIAIFFLHLGVVDVTD